MSNKSKRIYIVLVDCPNGAPLNKGDVVQHIGGRIYNALSSTHPDALLSTWSLAPENIISGSDLTPLERTIYGIEHG